MTAQERLAARREFTGTGRLKEGTSPGQEAVPSSSRPSSESADITRLRQLCYQAFDLRDGPYLTDAVRAIGTWADRREVSRVEAEAWKDHRALQLLRWRPGA